MDTVKMFINGEWVEAVSGKTREIHNPATGDLVAVVAEGDVQDTRNAVDAADAAKEIWKNTPPMVRAGLLNKAADILESRKMEIGLQECRHTGRLLRTAVGDVVRTAFFFRHFAGLATAPSGKSYNDSPLCTTLSIREPIGVCGLIIPWNAPLSVASKCIAPALLAGNTVVLKPSSNTPLGAVEMFKALEEAGFPKGVVNLVLGPGEVIGNELGENVKIGKVSLTGGTDTGRSLVRASASNIKKLSLELGGKSACIVFEDGDWDTAIDNIMTSDFSSAGQLCVAPTRVLVQDTIYDQFCEEMVSRVKKIRVGLTEDPATEMGPVISKAQLERVLRYIQIGLAEGAKLACGGHRITEAPLDKGFYIEPTVFIDVTNNMRIAQEEIFGPVVVIEKFHTEKEAFDIANDSPYGLGGACFTSDTGRAIRFSKAVKAACLFINSYGDSASIDSAISCTKQSGYSCLLGVEGIESYTDLKQVTITHTPAKKNWFKG